VTEPSGSGRLAELTIALSLAGDLGTGQPLEHGLRTCLLSSRVADALGLDAATRSCVYHVALLRFLGCTSDASDTAVAAGGDDLAYNAAMAPILMARSGEAMWWFVRHLAEDLPLHRRAGRIARALTDTDAGRRSLAQHCEVGARLAGRLGLEESVGDALEHAYERWDGKGHPDGLEGEQVPVAVRIVAVARDAELWSRAGGWSAAAHVLADRRGHGYEPAVADLLLDEGEGWLAGIGDDAYEEVLDAEPEPVVVIEPDGLDGALTAVADFTDLKSPFFRGHSTGLAALAADAARATGLPEADATALGRAALVHDVGRVGVPNGIWDRPGPLSAEQWERVRLHPYLTERVLQRCSTLSPFADLAGRHHERADGSGYHRGTSGGELGPAARLLATADAYHAMGEPRPHRNALTPADAVSQLLDDVDAGRFGRAEADAVLTAAGQVGRPAHVARPAGLTERGVDVLALIARGLSNKAVATELRISAKTVGHHVEHIYTKAGVRTRAGATLFAMEHGLLSP
jgi:HD-GYP domain-containing protein (c-di-GMP phosphodiesterase class II)